MLSKGFYPVTKIEVHPFCPEVLLYLCSQVIVDDVHHLFEGFDDRDFQASFLKVFSHFKADETASYHYGPFGGRVVDLALDLVDVRDRAQRHDGRVVNAWDGGLYRGGSGAEDKRIIPLVILAVILQVTDVDGFVFAVDGYDFRKYPCFHIKGLFEPLRGHDKQTGPFGYDVARIIG